MGQEVNVFRKGSQGGYLEEGPSELRPERKEGVSHGKSSAG